MLLELSSREQVFVLLLERRFSHIWNVVSQLTEDVAKRKKSLSETKQTVLFSIFNNRQTLYACSCT